MLIGLLKEIKKEEYRVALIPSDVKKLTKLGHKVIFEPNCGANAGFSDERYVVAGGIPKNKRNIFQKAEIIVKVKTPEEEEPDLFRNNQTLFSYLHYDGNEELTGAEKIRKKGTTAIAFEWVEKRQGNKKLYPLLTPMSEFTGIVGATKVIEIFRRRNRRLVGNFYDSIDPVSIFIIGIGTIGSNALNVFLHLGTKITILDKHPETLEKRVLKTVPKYLWNRFKDEIIILKSDEKDVSATKKLIKKQLPHTDILFFAAVRRPTFKEKHLIDKDMLTLMKKNSLLVDACANDHDLVESIQSYPEVDRTYKVNGVIHYANDHIPSMRAHDASIVLSHAIYPYLKELVNKGPRRAIKENVELMRGTVIANQKYTHKYTCERKKVKYVPVHEAMELLEEIEEELEEEILE